MTGHVILHGHDEIGGGRPRSIADIRHAEDNVKRLVGLCDKKNLILATWYWTALQSRTRFRQQIIREVPDRARGAEVGSAYYIPPWRLETLVNSAFQYPERNQKNGKSSFDIRSYSNFATLINELHTLEEHQDAVALVNKDILSEMYILTQRQFEWQRDFATIYSLTRYGFIYGDTLFHEHFENATSINYHDFVRVGFHLYAYFNNFPILPQDETLQLDIDAVDRQRIIEHLTMDFSEANAAARKLRRSYNRIAYSPSILRAKPILKSGNDRNYLSPLPKLIMAHVTEGLHYYFVGNDRLRTEVGKRFESYVRMLITRSIANNSVSGEILYGPKGDTRSPDLFIKTDSGEVISVLELKGKPLTAAARFSDDPLQSEERGFQEIAKGVFQLWRYFHDSRVGHIPEDMRPTDKTIPVLVTMGSWMEMALPFVEKIRQKARDIAREKRVDLAVIDQRAVAFCHVSEVETELSFGDVDRLLKLFKACLSEKYEGWSLESVARDLAQQGLITRDDTEFKYRDELRTHVPWWRDS